MSSPEQKIRVARSRALTSRRTRIVRILEYTGRAQEGAYLGDAHTFYDGDAPPDEVVHGVNPGPPEYPNLCVLPIIRAVSPDLFITDPLTEITFAVTYDQPDPTDTVSMHVDGTPAARLDLLSRAPIVVGGVTIGYTFTFDLTGAVVPAYYTLTIGRALIPECRSVVARAIKLEIDCIEPTITAVVPDEIEIPAADPTTITVTYESPLPDDLILVSTNGPPPTAMTIEDRRLIGGNDVELDLSVPPVEGDWDITVRRANDPSGCFFFASGILTTVPCPLEISFTTFPITDSGDIGETGSVTGAGFLSGPIDVLIWRTIAIDSPPFFVTLTLIAAITAIADDGSLTVTYDAVLEGRGPPTPAPLGTYNVTIYRTDYPVGGPAPAPATTCGVTSFSALTVVLGGGGG